MSSDNNLSPSLVKNKHFWWTYIADITCCGLFLDPGKVPGHSLIPMKMNHWFCGETCKGISKRWQEQMFWTVRWRQRVEAATPAAGRLPALRLQSCRPPPASSIPSLASPSEGPVDPRRMHLYTGDQRISMLWSYQSLKLKSISSQVLEKIWNLKICHKESGTLTRRDEYNQTRDRMESSETSFLDFRGRRYSLIYNHHF